MTDLDPSADDAPGVDPPRFEGTRLTYDSGMLEESEVDADPVVQLRRWLADAQAAGVFEHTAMSVATVGPDGRVSSRNVLLRQVLDDGLVFFTNYDSGKAVGISAHPQVALLISYLTMHRQVRIEGTAERFGEAESDAYFAGRPRDSQIASIASPQSREVADRAELNALVAATEAVYDGVTDIARPANWGGYVVRPDLFEFWQGRPSRLHDRLVYRRSADAAASGSWSITRLAP